MITPQQRTRISQLGSRMIAARGASAQMDKVTEECAEAILAIVRARHGRGGARSIAEEIAGLLIVSEQGCQIMTARVMSPAIEQQLEKFEKLVLQAEAETCRK